MNVENYLKHLGRDVALGKEEKEDLSDFLLREQPNLGVMVERVALYTDNRPLAVFSEDSFSDVLRYCRKVITERTGQEITTYSIPSMMESEMNTWNVSRRDTATIFLRDKGSSAENQLKTEVVRELIRKRAASIIEIKAKGETPLQRKIYATHFVSELAKAKATGQEAESQILKEYKEEIKRLLG